jgi:hypothetical protein
MEMARSKNVTMISFVCPACEGRTLRSVVVLQEVAEMQPEDASPCLLASRFQFTDSLIHIEDLKSVLRIRIQDPVPF